MEKSTIFLVFIGITIILAIGVSITNIVFAFKYKKYNLIDNIIIEKIEKDLNSQLIDNITLNTSCKSDEEEAVLEIWDGTKDIPAKNFTIINGNKICLKRKKETFKHFLNLKQIIPKDDNCPNDYKSCGIIDTLNRKLCVENSYSCPINSLDIELHSSINSELLKNKYSLYLGNGYNIYFLNEENDDNRTIISTFKISEGYPCINVSERNFTLYLPNEQSILKCSSKINRTYIDKRYIKFDKFESNYTKLYVQNGLERYIPYTLEEDKRRINLYGRPYFGVNNNSEYFNYDKIYSSQKLANNCNYAMRIISIIQMIIVILPIGFACNSSGNDSSEKDKDIKCIGIILGIIIILGFVTNFIISIIIYICIQRLKWYLTKISNVGDVYTNHIIQIMDDSNSYNYNFALGILITITLMLFCGIISLILYCKSKSKISKLDLFL